MSSISDVQKSYDLKLTRTFRAPRALVFEAWTKPAHIGEWWGPRGFVSTVERWEAHAGGGILLEMKGHGMCHKMRGKFLEIHPPERLRFTAAALDKDGNPMFENMNTVTFEEAGDVTHLTVEVQVMSQTEVAPQYLQGMNAGWLSSLDRLQELVEK